MVPFYAFDDDEYEIFFILFSLLRQFNGHPSQNNNIPYDHTRFFSFKNVKLFKQAFMRCS